MPEPAIEHARPTCTAQHALEADWQAELRHAYRDPQSLLRDLGIDESAIDGLTPPKHGFTMRVPRGFARRMRYGDARDPLLLQVLPRQLEHNSVPGFGNDPLMESQFQPQPGLIHKYHGRALLITTAACGVHCRYCFRRSFPYNEAREGADGWQKAVQALAADSTIEEAILSGGDPLSLSDDKLTRLIDALEDIPHVRRLRIHSRQPIVLPERITGTLLARLRDLRLRVVLVVHSNHAQELDAAVASACDQLRSAGLTLLNQAVMLANVNDDAEVQARLSERLFEIGVLPYYLHQLDPVAGAAHFAVADDRARGIMRELNARLPGYLVPRLVREVPGEQGKLPMNWGL